MGVERQVCPRFSSQCALHGVFALDEFGQGDFQDVLEGVDVHAHALHGGLGVQHGGGFAVQAFGLGLVVLHDAVNDGSQFEEVHGLDHVVVHAGFQALLPDFVVGVGGHGHDGDVGLFHASLAGADDARGLDAVHAGHLDVHEGQVEDEACEQFQGFGGRLGRGDVVAQLVQVEFGHFAVDAAVVHQEDAQGRSGVGAGGGVVRRFHGRGIAGLGRGGEGEDAALAGGGFG